MPRKRPHSKVIDAETGAPVEEKGWRPLWKGSLSFGLVNIPVQLISAVRKTQTRFHLLHKKDHARVRRIYVCSVDGKPVPNEELEKGVEVEKGRHVVMEDRELEALAPRSSRNLDLLYFLDPKEIDPLFYDTPFYLIPDKDAIKPYKLLVDIMTQSKKAAVSEIVMREREYLAIIRPLKNILCLDTLRYPNEIIFVDELKTKFPEARVSDKELEVGRALIESLTAPFQPEKLHNDYREAVTRAVAQKARGQKILSAPTAKEEAPVADLMAALQKSLAHAKARK